MKYMTKDNMGVRIARKIIQSKMRAFIALIVNQVRSTSGFAGTVTTLEENSHPVTVENTNGIGVIKDDGSGAPDQGENDESKQNICLDFKSENASSLSSEEATNEERTGPTNICLDFKSENSSSLSAGEATNEERPGPTSEGSK